MSGGESHAHRIPGGEPAGAPLSWSKSGMTRGVVPWLNVLLHEVSRTDKSNSLHSSTTLPRGVHFTSKMSPLSEQEGRMELLDVFLTAEPLVQVEPLDSPPSAFIVPTL